MKALINCFAPRELFRELDAVSTNAQPHDTDNILATLFNHRQQSGSSSANIRLLATHKKLFFHMHALESQMPWLEMTMLEAKSIVDKLKISVRSGALKNKQ